MQELRSRGREDDLVRSLTSTVEILPTTLCWLSTTARDEMPSLFISSKALNNGASPLYHFSKHTAPTTSLNFRDLLDAHDFVRPNLQSPQALRIQLIDDREPTSILPQELDQPPLTQNTCHLIGSLLHNNDSMDSAPEHFDRAPQVGCMWQRHERILPSKILHILYWDFASFASFLGQFEE